MSLMLIILGMLLIVFLVSLLLDIDGSILLKIKVDGSLDKHKARLVALGNHQRYGVNYEETFAPVPKMITIQTLLAIIAS